MGIIAEDTHTLYSCSSVSVRGGGTHVHMMTVHSGYKFWYCRQHCSTLSSLFSACIQSGDEGKKIQRKWKRKPKMRDMTDHVRTKKHVHDHADKLWEHSVGL